MDIIGKSQKYPCPRGNSFQAPLGPTSTGYVIGRLDEMEGG